MRSVVSLYFFLFFSLISAPLWASEMPEVEFLDLSRCHADDGFHPACRWISGRFQAWPDFRADQVRSYLKIGPNLDREQSRKLLDFYAQLHGLGLEKIQFVYSDNGTGGDQAETTMNGRVGIITLRPAFFASRAYYGSVSEQQHALIHELFHVLIHLTVGAERPDELFWRDLAHSLEWRNTRGANPLIDPRLEKDAYTRSRDYRAKGQWGQAVDADLAFARAVGFPSLYGMSRLSEYVPELGSFLVHDKTMAGALPRPVWDVIRRSPLAFLLAAEPRPSSLNDTGVRGETARNDHQFVGLLYDQNKFVCTIFVLRHGLVVTAKSCLNPAWPVGGHPGVRYSFLTLEFPGVDGEGSSIRVDGMQITGVFPDTGRNDFAYLTYDPQLTESRLLVPELKLVREARKYDRTSGANLFTVGFAIPAKPQRLLRLKSADCHFYGQTSGPGERGPVIKSDCPGWTGSAGQPVLSEGERPGQYNVWGVMSLLPSAESLSDRGRVKQDGWGRFAEIDFSPVCLADHLLAYNSY